MQSSRIRLHLSGPRRAQTLEDWMTDRRNTQRKQAVINAVKQVQSSFTAEELFHIARRLVPGISRATVYRTICILRDEGCVKQVCLPHGKRIFAHTDADVLCVMECEDCGRFTTFPAAGLSGQLAMVARERHLSPVHTSVYVRGQCQDWCATGRCPRKECST